MSTEPMKLHTETIGGNLHEAATFINKMGWADKLVTMNFSGNYTVAVFLMTREEVHLIRANNRSYVAPFDHDDIRY